MGVRGTGSTYTVLNSVKRYAEHTEKFTNVLTLPK